MGLTFLSMGIKIVSGLGGLVNKATMKVFVHIFVDLDIHFLCVYIHTQEQDIGVTGWTCLVWVDNCRRFFRAGPSVYAPASSG